MHFHLLDPRNHDWPLISSPWPVLSILIVYLYFVKNIGPKFMANRKPFDLQTVINVYNIIQILINIYIGFVVSLSSLHCIIYLRLITDNFLGFILFIPATRLQLEMSAD